MTNNLQKHEEYTNLFEELKEQFKEMGRLKSDFDIEKFTVKGKGEGLPAHQFHFLMRQYRFAVSEAKRMYIDKERLQRDLNELIDSKERDADIDAMDLQRRIDDLEIDLVNKKGMIDGFEICRQALIKGNENKPYTDKQYQEEEPKFWEMHLKKQVLSQLRERNTGIKEGTTEAIGWLEQPTLLEGSPNQVGMLMDNGNFDRISWEREIQELNGYNDRVKSIDKILQTLKNKNSTI